MTDKRNRILINHHNNRGFALPFTLSVGMVIMVVGTVMLVRSQTNRTHVKAQQNTAEGVSAAEVGVTRIFNLMNDNRYIAMYPSCINRDGSGNCTDSGTTNSWANISNADFNMTVCDTAKTVNVKDVSLKQDWIPIDENNPQKGEYRLLEYEYPTPGEAPNEGKLTVEGRINSNNQLTTATSQLEVTVPVSPGPLAGVPVPGVWLTEGATGGNTIEGDVLLGDCSANPHVINVTGKDPDTDKLYEAKHTGMQFPALPPIPGTATNLGVINSDLTLPRTGDTSTTKTINGYSVQLYEYTVDSINLKGGTKTLTITPGQRVRLYLQGSVEVGSNSNILHSCSDSSGNPISGCLPTDFQIFGYGDDTNTICVAGNKRIEGFIFAPEYTVGTAGTGGGKGGIKGTVWAKAWSNGQGCGSNTSNTAVVQTAKWEELGLKPDKTPPQLGNLSTWQRNER